jgi:23S rRNA (adenine2503-C2)-methyltransferase
LACETVLMIHKTIKGTRNTVCVSSQIGCKLGCDFCATGGMGFKRDLTFSEIVMQVLMFERFLKNNRVDNIVFMGMGEPMLNYENVIKAIRIINEYLKIGARKISISTSGVVPGIIRFSDEPLQLNLAISLHASNNSLRSKLMPINKKYQIEEVLEAVSLYIHKTGRKVMIEYIMLKDVNDSLDNAKELAKILKQYLGLSSKSGGLFFVNLISFNPTKEYVSSTPLQINKFKGILEIEGISVVQRYKFGRDIKGACGQLVNE